MEGVSNDDVVIEETPFGKWTMTAKEVQRMIDEQAALEAENERLKAQRRLDEHERGLSVATVIGERDQARAALAKATETLNEVAGMFCYGVCRSVRPEQTADGSGHLLECKRVRAVLADPTGQKALAEWKALKEVEQVLLDRPFDRPRVIGADDGWWRAATAALAKLEEARRG